MSRAPRYKQDFIVNGKYLGAALRQPVQVHESLESPHGVVYFCPYCIKIWAMMPVTDLMTGKVLRAFPRSIPCEQHDDQFGSIPGAITSTWDRELNSILPDEVVVYDFKQAMKLYKDEQ